MEITKSSWCYLVDSDPKLFTHSSIHNSELCQKYFPLYYGKKRKSKIALQACFEEKLSKTYPLVETILFEYVISALFLVKRFSQDLLYLFWFK